MTEQKLAQLEKIFKNEILWAKATGLDIRLQYGAYWANNRWEALPCKGTCAVGAWLIHHQPQPWSYSYSGVEDYMSAAKALDVDSDWLMAFYYCVAAPDSHHRQANPTAGELADRIREFALDHFPDADKEVREGGLYFWTGF